MTNVLIVDDERLVRDLFTRYIEGASDRYILACSIGDASNAELCCFKKKIDLILMDICTSNDSSGFLATKRIKKHFPSIKVILVTSAPEFRFLERAKEVGADSFWYKDVSEEELLDVMDRTMEGQSIYPETTPEVSLGLITSKDLTKRELEVLYWLSLVGLNKLIADKMGISEDGVDYHIRSLKEKTGAKSKTELAILAAKSRLVLPEF